MFNRKALRRAEAELERTQQRLDNARSWLEGFINEADSRYAIKRGYLPLGRFFHTLDFQVPYTPLANPFVSKIDESSNAGAQFLNLCASRMKLTPEEVANLAHRSGKVVVI